MIADAKKKENLFNDKKGLYREIIDCLLYDNLYYLVEKYAFNKEFKNRVLNNMRLCREKGNFRIEKGIFIGEYFTDDDYQFTLEYKNPAINFEEKSRGKVYQSRLSFSSRDVSYVCYKNEEVLCYPNLKDGKESLDYDTYNIEIERGVEAYDKLKIKIGNYKQRVRENFVLNRETGQKFLKRPSTFENYVEEAFSCRIGDNLFIREIKKYTHPDRDLAFIPLKDEDAYLRSTIDEDYFWGISKETAEKLNFPSDEEIKQYKKLIIT